MLPSIGRCDFEPVEPVRNYRPAHRRVPTPQRGRWRYLPLRGR